MKRTIFIFAFLLFSLSSFGQDVNKGMIVSKPDSTVVQRKIAQWTDSLNRRNFSDDAVEIKGKAEQLGNKAKETIKEHTPAVKELIRSVKNYLKR